MAFSPALARFARYLPSRTALLYILLSLTLWSAITVAVIDFTAPSNLRTMLVNDDGTQQPVTLPYSFSAPKNAISRFYMTFNRGYWPMVALHIVPDDCLQILAVNNVTVPLWDKTPCSFGKGGQMQRIDWYLENRADDERGNTLNSMIITVKNNSGASGLSFSFSPGMAKLEPVVKAVGLTTFALLLVLYSGVLAPAGPALLGLFSASLLLVLLQYFTRDYYYHAHEVSDHLDYIYALVNQHSLPAKGWQAHQPPLYYLLCAGIWLLGNGLGMDNPMFAVRLVSLAFYVGFIIVALKTITLLFDRRRWQLLAASLLLFWPDNATFAGSISNDVPMLLVHALALYWLVRWDDTRRSKYLVFALYTAFVGLMMKTTALISVAVVLVVCMAALARGHTTLKKLLPWQAVVIIASALLMAFGRMRGNPVGWLLNANAGESPTLIAPTDFYNFVGFDLPNYFNVAYFFNPDSRTDLFWNAFLKSLLFDEWGYNSPAIAAFLSGSLLVVLAVAAVLALTRLRDGSAKPLLLMLIASIGALMAMRYALPWTVMAEVRGCYAIVLIIAVLYTKGIEHMFDSGHTWCARAGVALGIAFTAASFLLVWNEQVPLWR